MGMNDSLPLTKQELVILSQITFHYQCALRKAQRRQEADQVADLCDVLIGFAQDKPREKIVAENKFNRSHQLHKWYYRV